MKVKQKGGRGLTKTRLSLCMIVKNEEDCIARCLNSAKDVVDEIIIVDTGSTDNTVNICEAFQTKVVSYEWNESFADARNYAVEKSSGNWIIWLDADEELDKADRYRLREGTHFDDYDVVTLHLINYIGDRMSEHNTMEMAHTRLFRNNGLKFKNKMHEVLDYSNVPKERIGHLNVKLHHYGYLNSIKEKKEKSDRNMKMLKQQIKEGENVHWAHYYIASEHYNKQQYTEALDRINLSIAAFLDKKVLPPSMVYKLKYSILIAMGSFESALLGIEKALMLHPDYVDLLFYKGMILYYLEKYEPAISCFEECIEMGEDNKNHLILKGVGSFQAWYYKSLCQQKLKKKEKAVVSIMNSLLIAPQYNEALQTLSEFLKVDKISVYAYMKKHFKGQDFQTLLRCSKNR